LFVSKIDTGFRQVSRWLDKGEVLPAKGNFKIRLSHFVEEEYGLKTGFQKN